MRKGAKFFLGAAMVSQAAALIRYVVLARMLGPTELGLAAMIVLTSQFFDSTTDAGAERFLIQDQEGAQAPMQGLVQLAMVGRGLTVATALVLFSGPLSQLYQSPQLAAALAIFAIVPVINGFIHMDLYRVQRDGNFRPESMAIILGEILALVGTAIAAWITRDHTAIIYGLALRAAVVVGVSHVTAQRAYRWNYVKANAARLSKFAVPLFINGLALFSGSQGDRILIGNGLGPAALGRYSAIFLLIYYPVAIVQRAISSLHLPFISGAQNDPAEFERQVDRFGGRLLLLALAASAGFVAVGPFVAPLLYGPQFAQGVELFAVLAVLMTTRLFRAWQTTVAIATGRTAQVMAANLIRLIALPLALLANAMFGGLVSIVAAFDVGEIVALLAGVVMLHRSGAYSWRRQAPRVAMFLALSAAILVAPAALHSGEPLFITAVAIALLGGAMTVAWRERDTLSDTARLARRQVATLINRR